METGTKSPWPQPHKHLGSAPRTWQVWWPETPVVGECPDSWGAGVGLKPCGGGAGGAAGSPQQRDQPGGCRFEALRCSLLPCGLGFAGCPLSLSFLILLGDLIRWVQGASVPHLSNGAESVPKTKTPAVVMETASPRARC